MSNPYSVLGLPADSDDETIRRRYLTLAGRLTRSARRQTLHLPARWPWHRTLDDALVRLRQLTPAA